MTSLHFTKDWPGFLSGTKARQTKCGSISICSDLEQTAQTMLPRVRPPPMERRPALPLPYPLFSGEEPGEKIIEQLLVTAGSTGGPDHLNLAQFAEADSLLLAAIDSVTGDSTLHRAAAAGKIDFIRRIPATFGRQLSQRPDQVRLLWVLTTHQNLSGDTALHAAGRAGSLRGVKAVYRLFHLDDFDVDNENRGPESSSPPAEYWNWADVTEYYDRHAPLPALDFVSTKNVAGRDAAMEARLAGHEEVAIFLDGLAEGLDPDGMRNDKDYLKRARRVALERHWYHDGDDEQEQFR